MLKQIGNSWLQWKTVFILLVFIIIISLAADIGSFFIFKKSDFPEPIKKPPISKFQKQSNQDSPFGMSGAYSRPFIANDNIDKQDVYKMNSELKYPYKDIEEMNIKWIRPGIDITWELVQPGLDNVQKGSYDWALVDNLYGRAPQGVSVFANIGLNQGLEPLLWKFTSDQAEKDYVTYIKSTVERYDGDGYQDMPGLVNPIKYWQTHNEPSGIPLLNTSNTDWQGFAHIQEITYKAIKESDLEAKVAIGGFAMGHLAGSNDPKFTQEYEKFFLPILQNSKGKYIDIFDIHYYGAGSAWPSYWKGKKEAYTLMRKALDDNGYQNTEIWFTETAIPSVPFGEKAQAADLVKRFVYPLSFGAKKIFWWNAIEGEPPLETDKPSNHMGVIYDGTGSNDPGYEVKKLSYYTYEKLIEVLEGSDWSNVEAVQESSGVYIYKFTKNNNPIWVAWNENGTEKEITISGLVSSQAKITEAVPKYESGKGVVDYNSAFSVETKAARGGKIYLILKDTPVFIEEN